MSNNFIQEDKAINYRMEVLHKDSVMNVTIDGDEDIPFPIDRSFTPIEARDFLRDLFHNVKEMDLKYFINPKVWNEKFEHKLNDKPVE